jgi:tetratricopeptide (TPR) repeat protein
MLPTVFLSLSGSDANFVGKVHKGLPDGLAYYYPKSFANGDSLIEAMETKVPDAKIFVLFASRASISSVWVGFELDQARVAKIKSKQVRILVFPIESGLTSRDLPEWMQGYWIGQAGLSPRDISRYIRNLLSQSIYDSMHASQVFGRGALIDKVSGQYLSATVSSKVKPNILIFGGHEGIGRRTVAKEFLKRSNPALPDVNSGPEFVLPQFSDLEDIYRSLRQEITGDLSLEELSSESAAFNQLAQGDQIREVCRCLSYFGTLSQAVWIVSGNGFFEDNGTLKAWVPQLFSEIAKSPQTKLCIISNRLIHDAEARPHQNLFQVSVGNVSDNDIKSLMIAVSSDFGVEPTLPNPSVITGIGGHPQIAKIAAKIAATQGVAVLEHDPKKLFDIQEEILGSSVDLSVIATEGQKILSILSWVPQLSSDLLSKVMIDKEGVTDKEFSDFLANLERSCLIQSVGSSYCIAAPIRLMFRRKYGYGSDELRASFSQVLTIASEKAKDGDQIKLDLIAALAFMASMEGGTLDPAFQSLLLPSTFQSVIRDAYNSRSHDDNALERVVSLGAPAQTMKMDETAREEILSYVVRAYSRMGLTSEAKELLSFFDSKAYRSRHYLRAFFIRHCDGPLKDAIESLREAYKVKKYMQAVVADLALCYQKTGAWGDLTRLLDSEGGRADENAGLLDIKAGLQISRREFTDAEITIQKLNNHRFGDGRGKSRLAMIMMHRDQDYQGAKDYLTKCLQESGANMVPTRRLRAIAAAYSGDRTTVENDIAFLKPKADGRDTANRLLSRLLLTEGSIDEALEEIAKVKRQTHQDGLLRARILEAKIECVSTTILDRKQLQDEVRALRTKHSVVSEFEYA